MADYYPLLARAIAGLEHNTGENRRALYERARSALVAQLRGIDPPLDEADVTRERMALEDAVRRMELEQASNDIEEPVPEPEAATGNGSSLRDQALRDYRETVAEAEGLGGATAEASRAARETFETSSPHPRPAVTPEPALYQAGPEHELPPDTPEEPAATEPPAERLRPRHPAPPAFDAEDDVYARPPRNWGKIFGFAIVILLIAGIGALGYWQRNTIATMIAKWRTPAVTTTATQKAPTPAAPAARPKIADRVGGDEARPPVNAPAAAVAQKVVLYEEDSNDPQGKRFVGSAIWRTETVSPGPGLAPELAVRADVEIPERRLRMTFSIRRNTDKALPASHTIEIMFTLPADFDQGGIGNVPGVLMKSSEQARGAPIAGLAVKVTNGYFLIGLSAVEADVQRNIQLLKERDWFDIPIAYTSGKRAILALEKGVPGTRAFEEVFRTWGQ